MIKTRSLYFLFFAVLITSLNVYSQDDSLNNLSFELPSATVNCDVYLSGSRKLAGVSLGKLMDTTVNIYKEGFSRSFNVGEIKRVTFKNHGFWIGAAGGFAGSVIILGILGLTTYSGGGHPDFGPG